MITLLSIVIPCYNEADNVEKLRDELVPVMQGLLKHQIARAGEANAAAGAIEVILVDDGSRDGTFDAMQRVFAPMNETASLEGISFRFEKHVVNQGLGAALRTGFAAAKGDVIITTDSDGTYKFETIPLLLGYLQPGVDIVTASPYHPDGRIENVPGYRVVLSKGSSLLYRILVDRKITCYTALFRAYRREVVKNTPFEANGFLAGTELMVKAMLQGYSVREFPTVLHSRVNGVSKAKIMRTIRAHLGFQAEILLTRMGLGSWKPQQRLNEAGS